MDGVGFLTGIGELTIPEAVTSGIEIHVIHSTRTWSDLGPNPATMPG